MDGLLIIDKPDGMTSHDVVNRVRRILKTKRVGHTGTLDPFATGVLVMLIGRATRLARFVDKDEKEYDGVVRFGFETDTGDRTGMQNAECKMQNDEVAEKLSTVSWEEVLSQFRGEIEQIPPMYSAKKVEGKKLYESARKGIDVERAPVRVSIAELGISSQLKFNAEFGTSDLGLRIVCSAGTYIRVLAEDIGRAVGVGAHLTELRRTRAGRFAINDAVTLEQLKDASDPSAFLKPLEELVAHLPCATLSPERIERTKNGLSTTVENVDLIDGAHVRMVDEDGMLVAIGTYDSAEGYVRPKIVLL